MRPATYRNLGVPAMIVGAILMALSLVVAGHARLTMTVENSADNVALMREAWTAVAGGAVLLLAGTLALERYRRETGV